MTFTYFWIFIFLLPIAWCYKKCVIIPKKIQFVNTLWFRLPNFSFPWQILIVFLVVLLLITALASPFAPKGFDPTNRDGVDIVLSIDSSGSMQSSGFDQNNPQKSKFEVVQNILKDFVQNRFEDNIALVMFGDFAIMTSPLSYEKNVLIQMIDYLTLGMVGQSTAIGEGIEQSVIALKSSKAKSKVIILLTDGRHNSGRISPKDSVKLAKDSNIKIYTIGVNSQSQIDEDMLKLIAKETGGEYFNAKNSKTLEEVYNKINQLETSPLRSQRELEKINYHQYFIFVAFLILWFGLLKGRFR